MERYDLVMRVMWRCTVVSFGFLLVWGLLSVFVLPKLPWVYELHESLFGVTTEQVNYLNYCLLGVFKMSAFFFFLIPWLVLRWSRPKT